MSAEAEPLDLPPDIQLVNQFIWHGMQALFRPGRITVQPELEFTDFTQDSAEPIGVTFHPDGTFPSPFDKEPWAVQTWHGVYPGYKVTQTTIARAENNFPDDDVEATLPLLPQVILELGATASLKVMRRDFDLDDAERRYLEKTQYFFWPDRPAMRQGVFNIGEQNNHLVAHRSSAQELQQLHNEVYSMNGCSCFLLSRNARLPTDQAARPLKRLRQLFGRKG